MKYLSMLVLVFFCSVAFAQKEKSPSEVVVVNSAESPVLVESVNSLPVYGENLRTASFECSLSLETPYGYCDPTTLPDFGSGAQIHWIQGRVTSSDVGECDASVGIGYPPPSNGTLSGLFDVFNVYAPGADSYSNNPVSVGREILTFPEPFLVLPGTLVAVGWGGLDGPYPPVGPSDCKAKFIIGYIEGAP